VSPTTNLKWYKDSGRTTEETNPTAVATAGMYYPFYVSATNGCFSNAPSPAATATVTITNCCATITAPSFN
jgi:N-methylhydantoinase B/oxoprolinase/acetone carboxylase alpha subunit